ncbi:WD40 repeat-like protein, partial [Coccomyxa subellipsoidea C-169]
MSNRGLKLKSTYRPSSKLEVFYTGGASCISSKGLLACSCNDEVKLVDPISGSVTSTLAGDSEPVTALAFSHSGNRLYGASRSLQQRCWDTSNNAVLRSWKGHKGPVLALAVDPSGGLLASASADRSCRVWDTDGFYCTHAFHGHRGLVLEVIFHPKELMIITAGDDAEVRVWDLITKSCVATLKDHFSAVTSLSLSPDGWTLLTAGRDKVAILWDLRSHKKLATVPIFEAVEGAAIVPDDSAFKALVQSALGPSGKKSKALVFATGGEKGILKLWRADTGDCIYEQRHGIATGQGEMAAAGEEIREVHVLPNAEGLMITTGDCRLLFFSPEEEAEKHVVKLGRQLIGNLDEVTDLRLIGPPAAPTQLVLATNSPTIRMFDLTTMSCSATLSGHTDTVLVLDAIQTKESKTLLASGAKDNSVRVWDEAGECIAVGQGHVGAVSALAFSRRAFSFLVTGGADKLLKVWDVSKLLDGSSAEGAEVPRLRATAAVAAHDKDINALAVSPNDALICTASQDRTAKVWRLPDLVQMLTLKGHRRGVWSVQFSPVDQCVLTGSGDATIRLWALTDGSCLRTFEGHGASVLRASFISAGTQVVSAGADGLVKLWGVRTSECTATFDEHEGKVWALAVAGENDAVLATGGADARVNIWRDCTAEDEAAVVASRTQNAVKAQELSNALKDNDYQAAAAMAFELGHAGQLRSVVEAACAQGQEAAEGILNALVDGLEKDQIKQCLEFIREWNTNSRHCHAAQATLQAILSQHAPEVLLDIPGVAALLDGLSAYTQRHMARIDRLRRSVALLDYTLGAMRVVAPQEAASAQE